MSRISKSEVVVDQESLNKKEEAPVPAFNLTSPSDVDVVERKRQFAIKNGRGFIVDGVVEIKGPSPVSVFTKK